MHTCQCGQVYDPAESKRKGLPSTACSLRCASGAVFNTADDGKPDGEPAPVELDAAEEVE